MYVPVVTLSAENDNKLLEQLKTGFKRTITWNRYRSEMSNQTRNKNLNYLIDPTFTKVNRLFRLSFENKDRTSFSEYYAPKLEIKDFNLLINRKQFFEIPEKNKEEAYEQITEMSRNNDYTTGNLLDYEYFSKHYRLIAIDLSKQTELENPDLKQQIYFIGRLEEDATMFFIIEKKEETKFCSCCLICIKMETQKIVNLLNDADNKSSEFATRKLYVINDQNNGQYGEGNENDSTIKFETKVIKPNLCDYSDEYIFVTGNIAAASDGTKVAFKNCAPFTRCVTHINDEHVETAENLDILMHMYNLIEYSENYIDSSASLWQFKRDEQIMNNGNIVDVTTANSSSFKYKSSLIENKKGATIAVPVKYLSNFFRSLEMLLINCKIHLELNRTKDCVMSNFDGATAFQITSTKLYVPIVTLSTKDDVNLTKQLNEGFKRSVYWNK